LCPLYCSMVTGHVGASSNAAIQAAASQAIAATQQVVSTFKLINN